MRYTIDAQGKKLGRIASETATLLRGKIRADFSRNAATCDTVEITNVSQMSLTAKKGKETRFQRYSGYPGGLKSVTMRMFTARRGYKELVRKAVYGMLPKNRMRAKTIRRLTVKN